MKWEAAIWNPPMANGEMSIVPWRGFSAVLGKKYLGVYQSPSSGDWAAIVNGKWVGWNGRFASRFGTAAEAKEAAVEQAKKK